MPPKGKKAKSKSVKRPQDSSDTQSDDVIQRRVPRTPGKIRSILGVSAYPRGKSDLSLGKKGRREAQAQPGSMIQISGFKFQMSRFKFQITVSNAEYCISSFLSCLLTLDFSLDSLIPGVLSQATLTSNLSPGKDMILKSL
jgi:hypothetical protein